MGYFYNMNPLIISALSVKLSSVMAMTLTHTEIIYGCFGIVLIVALLLDLGLMSKKGKEISIGQATLQTVFWIGLSLLFWGWLLGPMRALAAVPLSIGLRFLLENFGESRWLAHLMSDAGPKPVIVDADPDRKEERE